jgi:hypothetical protein
MKIPDDLKDFGRKTSCAELSSVFFYQGDPNLEN